MEHDASCLIAAFRFRPSSEEAKHLQERRRWQAALLFWLAEYMFVIREPRTSLEQLGTGRESYFS